MLLKGLSAQARYEESKWRYENHFKDEEHGEQLINDAHEYIKDLEERNNDLKTKIEELEDAS